MSEEIKITVPILDEEEKRRLENMTLNEMQPAIDEFTKRIIKDKDLAVAQIVIEKQQKEIEHLKRYKKAYENGEYTWKQKYEETFNYVKENYIPKSKIEESTCPPIDPGFVAGG